MVVCSCRAVTEREVEAAIRRGATSVEAIADVCGAGSDCGACLGQLCEKLDLACENRKSGRCGKTALLRVLDQPAANAG